MSRILFISVNDGTDTRICKEVASLSALHQVSFVGVVPPGFDPSPPTGCAESLFIVGARRSPRVLARLFIAVFRLRPHSYDSVHVINENLLLVLLPILLSARRLVLDVFDSTFLKPDPFVRLFRPLLQYLAYTTADVILVTDESRRALIPAAFRTKARVLPNYPLSTPRLPPRRLAGVDDPLRICFTGSLSTGRGTEFLRELLAADETAEVVAAGWIYDDDARNLCAHPRVRYHGVVDMAEAARLARQSDYILCLYSPDVPNNIYASPNKIYDSALLGVPVIINAEVRASSIVSEKALGIVLPGYSGNDPLATAQELRRRRAEFRASGHSPSCYTWDRVEGALLAAHLE